MASFIEASVLRGAAMPPFLPSHFDGAHSFIDYSCVHARGYTEVFQHPTGVVTALDDIDINTDWEEWVPFSGGLRFLFVLDGSAQIFQQSCAPIVLEPLSFGVAVDPAGVRKRQTRIAGRRWKAMVIFCPHASLARFGVRLEKFYAASTDSGQKESRVFTYQGTSLRERQHDLVQEIFHPRVSREFKPLYVEAKSLELLTITLAGLAEVGGGISMAPDCAFPSQPNSERMDRIDEICRIIAGNLGKVPSLAQLSRCVGVNRRQMCADFRAATGRSIGRYVLEKRMARARDLLGAQNSVKCVSHMVGYRHPQNFVTAYKTFFGRTPGYGQN
jgi:AraC-like DNA-binding protein